jgi:3-oxoacyl-[acyl-carrier protein] reductase
VGAEQGVLGESVTVVLVTGAGTAIGRALAVAFAHEGESVAVLDADAADVGAAAELVRGEGAACCEVAADVASAAEVGAALERVRSELGPVGVLVNASSYYEPVALAEQSEESWRRTWDVGVNGVFNLVRGVLPHMEGGGVIVNVSAPNSLSTEGLNTAYAGAKAALFGLTRALALELGGSGVRVVGVSPGYVGTLEELPGVDFHEDVPLRRPGRPDEIADLCVYLASEYASAVHGVDVTIDGGLWALNKAFSYNPPS